jgi:hypothetical protein
MALSITGKKRQRQMYQLGAAIRDVLPKYCSLNDAAQELGVTRQAASRIECRALAKMFLKVREAKAKGDLEPDKIPFDGKPGWY